MRVSPFLVAAIGGYLLATGSARADTALEDPAAVLHLRYMSVLVKQYARPWHGTRKCRVSKSSKIAASVPGIAGWWWQAEPGMVLNLADPRSMEPTSLSKDDRIGKETNRVFQVQDCRAFDDLLSKRGVHFIKLAADQPWGTTQVIVEDFYGNVFVAESAKSLGSATDSRAVEPSHP